VSSVNDLFAPGVLDTIVKNTSIKKIKLFIKCSGVLYSLHQEIVLFLTDSIHNPSLEVDGTAVCKHTPFILLPDNLFMVIFFHHFYTSRSILLGPRIHHPDGIHALFGTL